MPLPVRINYLDRDGKLQDQAVQPDRSGYQPDPEYHPTMVPVRCFTCRSVGICEFANGFNLKDGDALMHGKPIRGVCFRCQKETELIPLKVAEKDGAELQHLYRIRQTLEYMAKTGKKLGPDGLVLPLAKLKQKEAQHERSS